VGGKSDTSLTCNTQNKGDRGVARRTKRGDDSCSDGVAHFKRPDRVLARAWQVRVASPITNPTCLPLRGQCHNARMAERQTIKTNEVLSRTKNDVCSSTGTWEALLTSFHRMHLGWLARPCPVRSHRAISEDLLCMACVDVIVGQRDHKPHNFMVTPELDLFLFDNSDCMHQDWLAAPCDPESFSKPRGPTNRHDHSGRSLHDCGRRETRSDYPRVHRRRVRGHPCRVQASPRHMPWMRVPMPPARCCKNESG